MSSIPTKQLDGDVAIGRNVTAGGNADIQGYARVGHNLTVEGWLEAKNIRSCNKGIFPDVATLNKVYPEPHDGWFAGVIATDADLTAMGVTASAGKGYVRLYVGSGGKWISDPARLYEITVDVNQLNSFEDRASALEDAIATAQSTANAAKTAAANAQTAANTAQGTADGAKSDAKHNRELISDLQTWGQAAGWMVQRITQGDPDAENVIAHLKMHKMDEPDTEPNYADVVIAKGATESAAGAMTAQHVKDLAALKNDAFEVILFDHIEQSNIAAHTSKAPLSASADGCKVVYCRARERFLFGVPAEADSTELTYYTDWEGSERYGSVDSQGVKPAEGKLFIDIAEDNGNLLDIYIFREGALRQTGRSLYDYINDTSQALSALENSKGEADGLAPLDANKLIPEANIPQKYDNILFFDSVQAGAIVTQPGSSLVGADDEKATLIFSKARNRFVLGVAENAGGMPQKYYVNFPGSDRYGTPKVEGIRPASDKVYICRSTSLAYVWNGTTLAALVADYSSEFQNINLDIAEINESKGEPNGIAPLNADGVVPNENISDEARKSVFCDLFTAAAGSAGYAKFTNGVWDCKLNGLTLTYDEAVLIYNVTNGSPATEGFCNASIRTNLWNDRLGYCNGPADDKCPVMLFNRCANIEVIRFNGWVSELLYMFNHCEKLTKVIGGFIGDEDHSGNAMKELFPHSPLITSFKLHRLQHNFSFANNPLIDLDSFTYMVEHRTTSNTNAYTITVHADVYAKLTGDTTNEAAAALTADELAQWQALLTKAAGKHIAFASA